ncbi:MULTISPECIES: TonB-dependent receptor family protein [Acinetobacter]|uniref:TonB-dependent siderophore receptor n=1 Tax=Acinetobacter junii TaxID=40215 RepID=A0A365PH05_ACIJU|nr:MULTISPECIES: TonB-dependent siderophore receptor [Acinetobacter]RBA33411.1 TonB-dependent siderophore receptor [Acinetobacter junii]RBA41359.1 TonB-dependent siderophore receptor [Acinetobacter junii]RBA44449.1 TonB-dependent siderophore receptor [Acinetobacter junii]WLF73606.1 TonB-dependent siderophore receptor [Acinetobacter junii]
MKKYLFVKNQIVMSGLLFCGFAPMLYAATEQTQQIVVLPTIQVIGSQKDSISKIPGAAVIVSQEQIQQFTPNSTEEILKRVSGVYVKPEEESAIVGNIGMRGISSADYKTLILEDGVPVAPGLFVGNGRYYNPRIQRMDSIEVLKGSSALRYGPMNIGGVVNYRTKQPKDGALVDLSIGSWDTYKTTVELGGSSPTKDSNVGAILSWAKSDGFMDKSYEMKDAVIKAGTAIGDNQWVGVKFTHYENDANISYRGQFLGEYYAKKQNNPAPDDWFLTERNSFDINHRWDINPDTELQTLLYWSEMNRDSWRYGVNATASQAAGRWIYTDNVSGFNRAFERIGAETRLIAKNTIFNIPGEAEIGLRVMNEKMDDVTINATRATPRTGTTAKDTKDSAKSVALYAQNRFDISDQLSVTPGVRVERYEQQRDDKQKNETVKTSNTEVMPGLGVTYQFIPAVQLYASVYKAFSPALNGDSLSGMKDQKLDAETAVSWELGLRGQQDAVRYELTAFRMDFDNQIIPANSNPDFQTTNGGKTYNQGFEGAVSLEFENGFDVFANLTWIANAEFKGDRYNKNGSLKSKDGDRVPYTPEWVANLGVGYTYAGLRSQLSANYTGSQFTDELNTKPIVENTSGFFTGKIDAYTTVDLTTRYTLNDQVEFYGAVKNLEDKRYIASLRQGIYVGPERSFEAGVRYRF